MKVTTDACLFGAWAAQEIKNSKIAVETCLDVGTGTGLLALMIAQKNDARIDAIEIDSGAAEDAKENTAASRWERQISVINQNVLEWRPAHLYECIVSNPPFYENELKSPDAFKNTAHHDAGLKLSSLLSFVRNSLADDGAFYLLLPAKRELEMETLLSFTGLCLQQKVVVKQTPEHLPFRVMISGGKKNVEIKKEATITIKNTGGEYTQDFVALLKDYYLYL